jgi:hypothetical protein
MLRLSRASDDLKEGDVGQFFGFNDEEIRFAVDQAERFGYVERVSGRVRLTTAGQNLFSAGTDEPVLFQVVTRTDKVSFDLISFAPVEPWRPLTDFEMFALPELEIASALDVGNASEQVRQSFARYFHLLRPRRNPGPVANSLYTVDGVEADKRFSAVIPLKVSVRPDNPTTPEADLLSWKTGGDLDERSAILQACGNLVRGVVARSGERNEAAARELLRCAPQVVGRFERDGAFAWGSYFRHAIQRAGRLQVDRQTVPVVGRAWVDANRERIARAADYSLRREGKRPPMIIWIKPSGRYWGMSTKFVEIVEGLRRAFGDPPGPDGGLRALLAGEQIPDVFKHVCDGRVHVPGRALAPDLEVLLVPGRLCVVLAQSPIEAAEGFPIPLGIISFEASVVARVHGLVTQLLTLPGVSPQDGWANREDMFRDIDLALDCLPTEDANADNPTGDAGETR